MVVFFENITWLPGVLFVVDEFRLYLISVYRDIAVRGDYDF